MNNIVTIIERAEKMANELSSLAFQLTSEAQLILAARFADAADELEAGIEGLKELEVAHAGQSGE